MRRTYSIMQRNPDVCYLCGEEANYVDGLLETHHVFGGTANKKKSTQWGLVVRLHGIKCHRLGDNAVHMNKDVAEKLHIEGQQAFESVHGDRDDFRREFGKSYL